MRTEEVIRKTTRYISDVEPSISTEDDEIGEVIRWGDANRKAWKIVQGTTSAPFGRNSSEYMGCARGPGAQQVLDRLAQFKRRVEAGILDNGTDAAIHDWRAAFTLEFYGEKGFSGGTFRQWDGTYNRSTLSLDYTPATLESVIDRFARWADRHYATVAITLNGKVVRGAIVDPPTIVDQHAHE